ncbi:carbon-nitrogen hydrolase family protein [Phenylobacterium montanum]|uniref:Carbon-nitrogen hydrolase family protein n=1 Tax=Phenylobacterium montanum TaxID=2823693 RepID=A0A975FW88_9CAUL|nr:carbon-nitrogen hydrolase family protein [Caulobacter sp. S6]QUD85958.1 carbon-nitrogen hydrolase family protein [Caulobacter sp. S6]
MGHLGIAGLQLDLGRGDNLDRIAAEVAATKRRLPWVDLVMLGELSAFGPGVASAQSLPGPAEARFVEVARENKVWLIPGSLYERVGDQLFNTAPVIAPDGTVVARCRKLYPFLPYEQGVAAGEVPTVFDMPGVGRIGVSICYDMWFPETTRSLACLGAEVVLHPSMTSTIDREAEKAIARASAAQNQLWFVDINVAGELGVGGSCAYGPGGEIVHEAGVGREVIALDLDLGHVRRTRERGWNGLGQTLKSFRDGPAPFAPYQPGGRSVPALTGLGALRTPPAREAEQ